MPIIYFMFFVGLLHVLMPLVTLFVLFKYRDTGVYLWVLGGLMMGFSFINLAVNANLQDGFFPVLEYSIPYVAIIVAIFIRGQALAYDYTKAFNYYQPVLIAIISFLYLEFYRVYYADNYHIILSRNVILLISCIYLMITCNNYSKVLNAKAAVYIKFAYLILSVSLICRMLGVMLFDVTTNSFDDSITIKLVGFSTFIAAIMANMGYLALRLELLDLKLNQSIQKNLQLAGSIQQRAEKINQLCRFSFISNVGAYNSFIIHELAQPFLANSLNIDLLTMHAAPYQNQALDERLAALAKSNRRGIDLINDFRARANQNSTKIEAVFLQHELKLVKNIIQLNLQNTGISIDNQLNYPEIKLFCDKNQLSHVLINIFNNAIDSIVANADRQPDKTILLSDRIDATGNFYILTISDTGVGFPNPSRHNDFEFTETTKKHGTGIGLTITRLFVEEWGGKISAFNRDPHNRYQGASLELQIQLCPEQGCQITCLHTGKPEVCAQHAITIAKQI